MSQNAVVKRIVSPGVAEVSLMRQMQCGLNCKSCEGCAQRPTDELLALASNRVGAEKGNIVEVEATATGGAIGASVVVFVLPCIGLVLGYLAGAWAGLSEGASVAAAFVGLLAGFVPAVLLNRSIQRRKAPEFDILAIRR